MGLNLEQFRSDKKTYFAVIRSLEILGEASHHLPEAIKEKYPDIPWRKMKDFRNLLIHEYFGVDADIVWNTIQNELIPLKVKVAKVLSNE